MKKKQKLFKKKINKNGIGEKNLKKGKKKPASKRNL
jgi:hypothetical protein